MKRTPPIASCLTAFALWFCVEKTFADAPGNPGSADAGNTNAWTVRKFFEQDYLLGDWGGWRSDLSHHGVDFEFFYVGSLPSNLSGGLHHGSVYEGLFLMMLDVDTEKLFDFHGGHFHAGSLQLHGKRFSPNYVGDLNQVNLVDFPHGFRLWELWYEQKFLSDKVSLKFGEMAIDQDFIVPEYSKTFVNQTFYYPTMAFDVYDIPGYPPGNHALASTPYSAPGIRLRVDPIDQFYVQAGAYDGNPDRSYSGTKVRLSDDEGALTYFEVGYRLNQRTNDTGLPGNYKVGAYYHTDDFYDVYRDDNGNFFAFSGMLPKVHHGNYGLYLLAEQLIYRENDLTDPAKQGLGAFFRLGAAPKDRNLAQFGVDGGLVYKGLIPTRDYDSFGVAFSYLEISDDIRHAQRDLGAFIPGGMVVSDYEAVLEATYKAQIAAWWTLQPSFQWVMHPGGSKAIPDALVLILQTTVRF